MSNRKMWFDKPGTGFFEGLPLGNGRLGATLLGGIEQETITLNESSVWSGSFEQADREDAHLYLPEIRRLLAEGKAREAETLFSEHFTCAGAGSGYGNGAEVPFGCYQVLGKLRLSFFQFTPFRTGALEWLDDYSRELDFETARASVRFQSLQKSYRREVIVSAPDEVLAIRFTSSEAEKPALPGLPNQPGKPRLPGQISMLVSLDREERFETAALSEDSIVMRGSLPDGRGGTGVSYACIVKAVCKGGGVFTEQNRLCIDGADEVLLLVTAETDLNGIVGRGNADALEAAKRDMERASQKTWEELVRAHEAYYRPLFERTGLRLSPDGETEKPLPQRLREAAGTGGDPALDELYAAFAKYLFISSSRQGEIPANLQGIWAEEIHTPWNGDWHFNAQQMIYWPAEVWNLPELHEPYLELIRALQEPGEKTAKAYYGAGGWVVHTFTNPWGFTAPGEDSAWGSTTGSAAWLCQHLWDHYLYTRDEGYLKEIYPALRGAAQFYQGMLVEEPSHSWLVTSPSDSPENRYFTPEGENCALCMGPTYDSQLVRYLFRAVLAAAALLGEREPLLQSIADALPRLAPTRLGSDGRIMEWLEEFGEPLPYHRHVSHLWGVYPGDEITREETPELAEGAMKSLEARRDLSAEWGIAHRGCIYARLHEPELAYSHAQQLLLQSTFPNLLGKCHHAPEDIQPTRMPRYDDYHFPFQMDGNMGLLTLYAELLMQSFARWDGERFAFTVSLLPSLPKRWKTGSVRGLRAKGGFTVDIDWEEGRLTRASLSGGGPVTVLANGEKQLLDLKPGVPAILS